MIHDSGTIVRDTFMHTPRPSVHVDYNDLGELEAEVDRILDSYASNPPPGMLELPSRDEVRRGLLAGAFEDYHARS